MQTLDEIISAAALLSPGDLEILRSAIDHRGKIANAIEFKTSNELSFRLYRQSDSEHWDSRCQSLAINEDYSFYLQFHYWSQPHQQLNLAQVYLTLKHLTGESSRHLDDHKMAFSFPFAIDVIRQKQTFVYFLEVRNIRDSLYFTLRKKVETDDKRLKDRLVHSHFEDEFGKEDMRIFRAFFYGYLLGAWQSLKPAQLEPFVRRVPAALLLLGYCDGKAFEEEFESVEKYEAAWQHYLTEVEQLRKSNLADPCIALADRSSGDRV